MSELDRIKKIILSCSLDKIWLPGFIDFSETIAEIPLNTNYLYFELGENILCLQAVDGYGEIEITISDRIVYEVDLDERLAKVNVRDIVLINPLSTTKITNVGLMDVKEYDEKITCVALHMKLDNEQELFIDPGFCGINIGGIEQKKFWLDNLLSRKKQVFEVYETWI